MMCPRRGQGGVPPWQNGHGEAPVGQSRLTSWFQGQVVCTGAPATQQPRPHLDSGEGRSMFLGFRHPELGRDALSPGWDTCHLSGMDPEDRGQQHLACLCPRFPKSPSPILAFSTWKSLVRKPSVLCMWSAGRLRWCHSPHLAPDRTGDAAFVQGNTDGDFYGGSDRNLRYRFW